MPIDKARKLEPALTASIDEAGGAAKLGSAILGVRRCRNQPDTIGPQTMDGAAILILAS